MSQSQLAEACGLEQPHVSRYESGRHEPSLSVSRKMAETLGVSMEQFHNAWLLGRHIDRNEK
jgi:transcriptional regulator with XRE-family HTH domain